MQVKWQLQPIVGYAVAFPTTYEINGEVRILTGNQYFHKRDRPLRKDETDPKEMLIHFPQRAQPRDFIYNTDDEGKALVGPDAAVYNVIEGFFMHHPVTLINGKEHANSLKGAALFNLTDVRVMNVDLLGKWDKKRIIANHLEAADLEELRSICFYLGEDPKDKSRGGIILELADYDTGKIFVKGKTDDVINTFIKDETGNKELKIITRKAISLKVIETQVKDNKTVYYLSGEFMGGDFDQVMDFLKRNPKIYETFVKPQVEAKDDFTQETLLTKHENQSVRDSAGKGEAENVALRAKIVELIAELDAAKVEHGVKRMSYQTAKGAKLQAVYDKLIALRVPAEQ